MLVVSGTVENLGKRRINGARNDFLIVIGAVHDNFKRAVITVRSGTHCYGRFEAMAPF